jgi:hypothetical protein
MWISAPLSRLHHFQCAAPTHQILNSGSGRIAPPGRESPSFYYTSRMSVLGTPRDIRMMNIPEQGYRRDETAIPASLVGSLAGLPEIT